VFQLALTDDERRRDAQNPISGGPEEDASVERIADDVSGGPRVSVVEFDPDEEAPPANVLDGQSTCPIAEQP